MLDFVLIGKNIHSYRLASNLTQKALAEKLDVTPDYISKIENAAKHPSLSILEKIGELFEIDIYTLMVTPDTTDNLKAAMDEELFSKTKKWEPETKRMLFKIAKSMTDTDKAFKSKTNY